MRSLERVTGKYRIYLRDLEADAQEGVCFTMRSAFLLANTLATVNRERVYVTEEMGAGVVKRLYVVEAGGGMPELMREQTAIAFDPSKPPMRGLEVD